MQEGADYISLLHAIRQALPVPRYLLTIALPAAEWTLKFINLAHASDYVDLINLMTYDFAGPWTDKSGYHAQLHAPSEPDGVCGHCGINYLLRYGVPLEKVLLGIPLYGRSFLGATSRGERYYGVGGEEGTFKYRDLPRAETTEQVDEAAVAAYCVGADGGFVSYDNPQTVRTKALYVKSRGLGGLFYWEATGDADPVRSLVRTGYMTLHC
jgi:chitinase